MNIDNFIRVFGKFTVAEAVYFVLAAGFLFLCYRKVRDYLGKKYASEAERDKQLAEALEAVRKYPEYRQQSLAIQEKLESQIGEIKSAQDNNLKRLEKMEKDMSRRERNKLRDRLIQSFRYYASADKNPLLAWTRMEQEAFWEMFRDYEAMDGNGYVHTAIQPAMEALEIIEMSEAERITRLMESRA